jgi:hypothetical protein
MLMKKIFFYGLHILKFLHIFFIVQDTKYFFSIKINQIIQSELKINFRIQIYKILI